MIFYTRALLGAVLAAHYGHRVDAGDAVLDHGDAQTIAIEDDRFGSLISIEGVLRGIFNSTVQ